MATTQPNIVSDVGTLLRIPAKITNELTDKACLCIGSAISEAKNNGEAYVILNIGIGTLSVDLIDMQCKFVPGKNLKTAIKSALNTQSDPVELALEQALADKLLAICEEVF
jgi:hypothetical protein